MRHGLLVLIVEKRSDNAHPFLWVELMEVGNHCHLLFLLQPLSHHAYMPESGPLYTAPKVWKPNMQAFITSHLCYPWYVCSKFFFLFCDQPLCIVPPSLHYHAGEKEACLLSACSRHRVE